MKVSALKRPQPHMLEGHRPERFHLPVDRLIAVHLPLLTAATTTTSRGGSLCCEICLGACGLGVTRLPFRGVVGLEEAHVTERCGEGVSIHTLQLPAAVSVGPTPLVVNRQHPLSSSRAQGSASAASVAGGDHPVLCHQPTHVCCARHRERWRDPGLLVVPLPRFRGLQVG